MNILFLSLLDFSSIQEHNIYTDLLREFIKRGHNVCCISPIERGKKRQSYLVKEPGCQILKLRIGNTQKTGIIEKGISIMTLEPLYIKGIKKFFNNTRFNLLLYATPPITLCNVIKFVKRRDRAFCYLMLKDIFPQNAVDLGMLSTRGPKKALYMYFRSKEKELYRLSDHIGCMSKNNVKYLLDHNPEVKAKQEYTVQSGAGELVDECPNSIEPMEIRLSDTEKEELRAKYRIPSDCFVFVYGGNLGKPQGIDFMLRCMHGQRKNNKVFFLIVGDGTEYIRIESYIKHFHPTNIVLYRALPKEDYDRLIAACDVGMIFLDYRFTIPNFPSRLLGYMNANLPVFAVTDDSSDIGNIIIENGFGWCCKSDSINAFGSTLDLCMQELKKMKIGNSFTTMQRLYNVRDVAEKIENTVKRGSKSVA